MRIFLEILSGILFVISGIILIGFVSVCFTDGFHNIDNERAFSLLWNMVKMVFMGAVCLWMKDDYPETEENETQSINQK